MNFLNLENQSFEYATIFLLFDILSFNILFISFNKLFISLIETKNIHLKHSLRTQV